MDSLSRPAQRFSQIAVLLGLALAIPAGSEGQRYSLTEPNAVFPEALSSVVGLRELSDGRVVVSDRLGQAVMILDLAAALADTIGRTGGGPGEYRVPGPLFPWRGDSTLMLDLGNTRFTMIGPDGGFGVSTPLMTQDGDVMQFVMPAGTDRHGNVYFQARSFGLRDPGVTGPADSAMIARWNLDSDASDTVVALQTPATRMQTGGGNVAIMSIPFSPQDEWAVAWDGRVAVARGAEFHVEWHGLDGAVVQGPTVSYEPVEITQADKDAWMEARANPQGGAVFVAVDAGGGARAAAPAGGARFEGPQFDDDDWPDVKPPFPAGAVAVTPEGNVWVRRHVKAGSLLEYDVFDGKGRPVQTVVLPEQGRVVGFGKGVVFVARSDEYDLQWLERYQRFWLERR